MTTKSNQAKRVLPGSNLPIFVWQNPRRLIDRNRHAVDVTSGRWTLHEPSVATHIVWDKIKIASDIKDSMKAFIAHRIEAQAPASSGTTFHHLKKFALSLPPTDSAWELSFPMLEEYLTKLRSVGGAWKFIRVRQWYVWCVKRRIPGFSEEIAKQLAKLKVQPNPTGIAVMSRDPEKGPFTEHEHRMIRQAVRAGIGTLRERAGVMLLLELGSRPMQLILLEEQDFKSRQGSDGNKFYSLDVPRLKQRVVGKLERKTRRITLELGQVIEQLIEENHHRYGNYIQQMPLFCRSNSKRSGNTSQISRLDLFMPRDSFQKMVVAYSNKAKLVSQHTGEILKLYPIRFRYTFGTRHAEQGTPATFIAESLDHSNLRSVRAYTASTSNLVTRLNLLAEIEEYVSVMSLFMGVIVPRTGREEPNMIIKGTTPTLKNIGDIGMCGANFLCKLLPPISCYICPKFQAWLDGPHEKMLHELETHIQNLASRTGNPSDRIPHQLSDVIAAIKALLLKIHGSSPERKSNERHQPT